MDLNNLLNTPPSHKRTSSKAENLNIDQPAFKQPRPGGSALREASPSSSSSSSSSEASIDDRPEGVYVVLKTSGDPNAEDTSKSIIGVFVSRKDAKALVETQRLGMLNGARKVDPEDIQKEENGWYWVDENAEDGEDGLIGCEMEFHRLIWPTVENDVSSPSSESSQSSGDVPASRPGEKSDVDMMGGR